MEWVKLPDAFFQQGPDYELEAGWMSVEDAQKKFKKYGDKALGICVQNGDDSMSYCVIVPQGTPKFWGEDYYVMVYKNPLPTSDDIELFEDDFTDSTETGHDGAWARPGRGEGLADEFQNITLFSGISPSDLHQGQLGDCWLVSAFAAMAEFPFALEELFIKPSKLSPKGEYNIKLFSYAANKWQTYTIDDRIPEYWGRSMYCDLTEDGEIWPCLLEKAFANYSGGYNELEGGSPLFALGAMTGCTDLLSIMSDNGGDSWMICAPSPSTDQVHDLGDMDIVEQDVSQQQLLTMLADFDEKNYIMCACSTQGANDQVLVDGIHQSHAYSLLTVLPNCAGSGFNLLCIRNPHGQSEWTGDWSDDSDMWDQYPAVAEACGHEVNDDGLFWIAFEDFCQHYAALDICKKTMKPNRGKILVKNVRALNLNPIPGVLRGSRISPAMEKKRSRAAKACGPACSNPLDACVVM